jgi:hypothetical protein
VVQSEPFKTLLAHRADLRLRPHRHLLHLLPHLLLLLKHLRQHLLKHQHQHLSQWLG